MTGLRVGAGPIPSDGAVLSGDGQAAQQLVDLMARQQAGMAPSARLLVSSPISVSASLGVEPVVLRDGARAPGWRDPNLINPRQPHTLIGWNKAGETYFVAVDGRSDDSDGVTMAQAADFLLGLGATDAVSLDGGGGTTFVAGKSVWNRPSDGSERGAVNAFVVMAKPGLPLPPAAPPKPAPPQAPPGTPGTPGSPGTPGTPGSPTSGGVAATRNGPGHRVRHRWVADHHERLHRVADAGGRLQPDSGPHEPPRRQTLRGHGRGESGLGRLPGDARGWRAAPGPHRPARQ